MDAHAFMRKFANDYYKLTLDEILRAELVSIKHLYGMDFILIDWVKHVTDCGTWYYIVFKEIYQDHVLEANYTTINAECFAGVDSFKGADITQYMGDHMRFTPLEYSGYDSKPVISMECIEMYDGVDDSFISFEGRRK